MANDILQLKNTVTGEIRNAPVGFSWTSLFFGFWPAIIRADWKYAVIIFILDLITWGAVNIVFGFVYNKLYIKDLLLSKGFKVLGCNSGDLTKVSGQLGIDLSKFK